MAVAGVGWKSGWELEYVGASAVVEWEKETRKRTRDGEAVTETWTLDVPYDVLELIVKRLDDVELAWVRGVCRGMCAAVHRVHRVRHARKAWVPRVMLTQTGAGRGVERMRMALAKWTEPKSEWRRRGACAAAAAAGCLEALVVARENGCDWNWCTCAWAARGGHLAVLKWARENGCEWDSWTCAYAAQNGHLAVLQWARTNGCKWDWCTCAWAAQNGHLAVLQWAHANGCEWDSVTCAYAKQNGHTHVLEWVHDRPVEEWPCAGKGGCRWAQERGLAWGA